MFSLTSGRHQKAGQHAMGMRPLGRAGAEANFSKNPMVLVDSGMVAFTLLVPILAVPS